eukprot:9144558-Pyramimonas_sp.AAC.1
MKRRNGNSASDELPAPSLRGHVDEVWGAFMERTSARGAACPLQVAEPPDTPERMLENEGGHRWA